jgi:hypothetical protein
VDVCRVGGFCRGLLHGGLAGVQHQQRHAGIVQQLAEFGTGHRADVLVAAGMLKNYTLITNKQNNFLYTI